MAIDGPQINRPACPAARAENVEPRRSGEQRGPNRGRPSRRERSILLGDAHELPNELYRHDRGRERHNKRHTESNHLLRYAFHDEPHSRVLLQIVLDRDG